MKCKSGCNQITSSFMSSSLRIVESDTRDLETICVDGREVAARIAIANSAFKITFFRRDSYEADE